MKIDFEDRTWQFEFEAAGVAQTLKITAYSAQPSLLSWYKSLTDPETPVWLKSMQCLYWLMCEQNGQSVDLESAEFPVMRLFTAWATAAGEGVPDAAAEMDPTKPAGEPGAADSTPPLTPAG